MAKSNEKETLEEVVNEEEILETETEEVADDVAEEATEVIEPDPLEEMELKYKKLLAEYDNFRKRSMKEKQSAYTDSVADTIEKILPVIDNFDRAMQVQVESEDAKSFKQGMELILKQLNENLSKMGVEPILAVGESFDPNYHNAVMMVDDESFESGSIVEELQKGYMFKDKVIRHSMVKVAN